MTDDSRADFKVIPLDDDSRCVAAHYNVNASPEVLSPEFLNQLGRIGPGADTARRQEVGRIQLRNGDEIRVEGLPQENDPAAFDYVEILPQR